MVRKQLLSNPKKSLGKGLRGGSIDPPDRCVVILMDIGVLNCELGLSYSTEAMEDHHPPMGGGRIDAVECLMDLCKLSFPAGKVVISVKRQARGNRI